MFLKLSNSSEGGTPSQSVGVFFSHATRAIVPTPWNFPLNGPCPWLHVVFFLLPCQVSFVPRDCLFLRKANVSGLSWPCSYPPSFAAPRCPERPRLCSGPPTMSLARNSFALAMFVSFLYRRILTQVRDPIMLSRHALPARTSFFFSSFVFFFFSAA